MVANSIIDFLHLLDEHALEKEFPRFPLYLFGAAAVVLAYGALDATKDVDAIQATPDEKLSELAGWAGKDSDVHKRTGFYFEAVPPIYILEAGFRGRARRLDIGLRVIEPSVLGPEDLIITKLKRFRAGDREDIATLCRAESFDADTLLELYEKTRIMNRGDDLLEKLDSNFNQVRTSFLGLDAIDWSQDY